MEPLPPRADMEQLKRIAKDRLRKARRGDVDFRAWIGEVGTDLTLSNAQLRLARQHGFSSWSALHLEVARRRALDTHDPRVMEDFLQRHPGAAVTELRSWRDHPDGASPLGYVAMVRFDTVDRIWRDVAGSGDVARILIEAGAPIDGHPEDRETPLITAASYGDVEVAAALIAAGADLDALAAPDAGGVPGGSALLHAAVFGMTEVVDLLVVAGARIRSVEEAAAAGTLDHVAASHATDTQTRLRALVMAADHERTGVIDMLVQLGVPVDEPDVVFGRHPLRLAAGRGRVEAVRSLLAHGADPAQVDPVGLTPLDHCHLGRAAAIDPGNHDLVADLLLGAIRSPGSGCRPGIGIGATARSPTDTVASRGSVPRPGSTRTSARVGVPLSAAPDEAKDMAEDTPVDDDDTYWQPGQPWRPRPRREDTRRPWETPADPMNAVSASEPTAERPTESANPASAATSPGLEDPIGAAPAEPSTAPSPMERPDATVLMPVITPSTNQAQATQAPRTAPTRIEPPEAAVYSPTPPSPPPTQRPPAQPPARRRRSRTRRFFGRLLVLVLVVAVLLGAGAFWVEGQLARVETPSASGGPGPETFLIVGSDSRENLPDDLDGNFGDFGGQRADVIILAQVSGGTVRMLSLPRDLKVEIPGSGTDKVNAAYAYGGPDLLIQTIQQDLGIPVDRYIDVEFGGFASIVDSVGGVELTFEYPTRDLKSGLEVDAGTQRVDGATALAYVRSRSTEEFRDGDWRSADGGDIARTGRQREVLEGIIGRALTPAGLIRIPAVVPAMAGAVRVGDSTHSWNLGLFAFRFATASANESMALPVTGSTEGGVSYVVRTEEATPAIQAFVSGEPLPVDD